MRTEITYEEACAIYNSDMCEGFEVFVQQQHYLEVLNCYDDRVTDEDYNLTIVGFLSTFSRDDGLFCNASDYFDYDVEAGEYKFQRYRREGRITMRAFRYDTMADATAHAAELLSTVSAVI